MDGAGFVEAKVILENETDPSEARTVEVVTAPGPDGPWATYLRVRFAIDPDTGAIAGVEEAALQLPGNVTPTQLQRFPWAKHIAIAERMLRRHRTPSRAADEAVRTAAGAAMKIARSRPHLRPGQKGHPPEFYQAIADRYLALLDTDKASKPTQQLADELHYSRNTMAGLIRRARQLGYLPPARQGRAG